MTATMTKIKTLPDAKKQAKAAAIEFGRVCYVLRPDGDTDGYDATGKHRLIAGWMTGGLSVGPSDCPCIIAG